MPSSLSGAPLRRRPRPRAQRLGSLLLQGLVAAGLSVSCGSPDEPQPPSIILISIDTLRADHTGFLGYERDTTPYLDRLSEEGLIFEQAFAPAPWTLVSHMTMLTGLYPNQHGVVTGEASLSPEVPNLAERLSQRGYQTLALFYEGWIHRRHGFDRGFGTFRSHRNAEEAGEHLNEELARLSPTRPFFLFLHLFDVHSGPLDTKEPGPIYDCPPPYDELFLEDAAAKLPQVPEGRLWVSLEPFTETELEALAALYDGGIRYVDHKLELWIEDLRTRGLLDNTLLIITSDHGESLGIRGTGIADHGAAYQDGLHVPLLVRLPGGASAGTRISTPVHLADVVPTALALAGVPAEELPGVSLAGEIPESRLLYCWSPSTFEMVVDWPKKYVHLVRHERFLTADLERDPGETTSDALDQSEFEAQRRRFLDSVREFPPAARVLEVEDMDALQEELKRMGYAGEDSK